MIQLILTITPPKGTHMIPLFTTLNGAKVLRTNLNPKKKPVMIATIKTIVVKVLK